MAAANPCDAPILIVSATHGSTQLGMAVGFSFEYSIERVVIPAEGVTGPSCRGIVRRDLVAVVDFLVKGPIEPDATAASLVIVTKDSDGDSITDTLTTMIPDGFAKEMNRDAPPGRYRQRFVHKGAMSSNPVS